MDEELPVLVEFSRDGAEQSAVVYKSGSRMLLMRKEVRFSPRLVKLSSAFLPEGYPSSVSSDYLAFQAWDTLQGVSTYIRSMLSTQALLSGIGVGAASATAIGATFQWFLRDLTGMVGGILFTLYQGSNLDSRAKQWRLAADFINDIGMLLDLISPLFPSFFMFFLCLGSAARAVTGVASGATRAALTHHFARRQNAADVSAKEGSQETAATLVGMVIGMLLARYTAHSVGLMWAFFLFLTAFHMYANYRAVRSLCLTSLNAERISIVLQSFLRRDRVPSPKEASVQEVLFPFSGNSTAPAVIFGARITSLCSAEELGSLLAKHQGTAGKYLISCNTSSVHVVLHREASRADFLQAYVHSLLVQHALEQQHPGVEDFATNWMEHKYSSFLSKVMVHFVNHNIIKPVPLQLQDAGWDTTHILISTGEWRADWTTGKKND